MTLPEGVSSWGLKAYDIYFDVPQDEEVTCLVEAILGYTYRATFGQSGSIFVSSYFKKLHELTRRRKPDELKAHALEMRVLFVELGLSSRYTNEFRVQNLSRTLSLVPKDFISGTVIDVGADDDRLGERLLSENSRVSRVIGVDIEERNPKVFRPNLEFRRQTSPSLLPVTNSECRSGIIRYSLHHMRFAEQLSILSDLNRVLEKHGHLVIFENAFSRSQKPFLPDREGFHARMLTLGQQDRITSLLAALDVFSLGIKDKHMPFPHAFRTLDEWRNIFESSGFSVTS